MYSRPAVIVVGNGLRVLKFAGIIVAGAAKGKVAAKFAAAVDSVSTAVVGFEPVSSGGLGSALL